MDFFRELPGQSPDRTREREEILKRQIIRRGITEPAARSVPRHLSVPPASEKSAR